MPESYHNFVLKYATKGLAVGYDTPPPLDSFLLTIVYTEGTEHLQQDLYLQLLITRDVIKVNSSKIRKRQLRFRRKYNVIRPMDWLQSEGGRELLLVLRRAICLYHTV